MPRKKMLIRALKWQVTYPALPIRKHLNFGEPHPSPLPSFTKFMFRYYGKPRLICWGLVFSYAVFNSYCMGWSEIMANTWPPNYQKAAVISDWTLKRWVLKSSKFITSNIEKSTYLRVIRKLLSPFYELSIGDI